MRERDANGARGGLLGGAWRSAAGAALICALALPMTAQEAIDEEEPVVPPGQEQLLASMLGRDRALPDGCRFLSGQADGPVVRATYACPRGGVVLDLTHAGTAGPDSIRTAQFAISLRDGAPSDALVETIVTLIRTQEDAFAWASPSDDQRARAQYDPG